MKKILVLFAIILFAPYAVLAEDAEEGELQLQLSKIMFYAKTDQADKALTLMKEVKEQHPDNPQVLSTEADVYMLTGNRRMGLMSLQQAEKLAPGNEDISDRKYDMLSTHMPFFTFDRTIKITGDHTLEQFARILGEKRYSPLTSFGIILENDTIRTPLLRAGTGLQETVKEDKQRGQLYMAKDWENGNKSTFSLYGGEQNVGAGASYTWIDQKGYTSLEGILHRPEWDYVESVIEDGAKDSIILGRNHQFTPRLSGTIDASLNRYSLDTNSYMASSTGLDGTLSYKLPAWQWWKQEADVSINYALDAEYPFEVKKRTSLAGYSYKPLPVTNREVHSLYLNAGKELFSAVRVNAYGGYAVDRLGGDGPLFGMTLDYSPQELFTLSLQASHSIRTENTSEKLDMIGVQFRMNF